MTQAPNVSILPSIADAAIKLGENEGGRFLFAITNYLRNGVIPEFTGTLAIIWGAIFPNLENSRNITIGRSKGGTIGGKASKRNNPNGRRGKAVTADDPDHSDSPQGEESQQEATLTKPQRTATARFTPPSVEEVQQYITAQGYTVNAANFVDFYAAKGWMIGKGKMKDWRAAVRTWQSREKQNAPVMEATTVQFTPNDNGEVNVCGVIVKLGYDERIDAAGRRTYGNGCVKVPFDAPRRPAHGYEWSNALNDWIYNNL